MYDNIEPTYEVTSKGIEVAEQIYAAFYDEDFSEIDEVFKKEIQESADQEGISFEESAWQIERFFLALLGEKIPEEMTAKEYFDIERAKD